MIPRKLALYSIFLILLGGAAVYLWKYGKPVSPSHNPLKNIDVSKIRTIVVENQLSTTTLQNRNGSWMVAHPVEDAADPVSVDRLIVALKDFTVGSILSTNKEKYNQFDLSPEKAGRIQVFTDEGKAPVLDLYVGKLVPGQTDCYVRFEGKEAVYIANDLPNYLARKTTREFRLIKLVSIAPSEATAVRAVHGRDSWNLIKSSNVWTNEVLEKPVNSLNMSSILDKVGSWSAMDFAQEDNSSTILGLQDPYMKLKIETPQGSSFLTVGNKVIPSTSTTQSFGDARYVSVEGRKAVMIFNSAFIEEILAAFKAL